MKARNLIALVVVLAVVASMAWFSSVRRSRRGAPSSLIGTAVLPDLPVNDVEKIVFQTADSTVTVAKVADVWVAPDKYNYPVEFGKVRDFLWALSDLKVGQVIRASRDQLAKLDLISPAGNRIGLSALAGSAKEQAGTEHVGTLVKLQKGRGKEIASILLGKTHMKKPSGEYASRMPAGFEGYPDGRYIKTGRKVFLVSETLSTAPQEVTEWLNRDLVNIYSGDIMELTVTGPGRKPITLTRFDKSGDWKLDDLGKNQELDTSKVNRLAGALSYLRFEDVADPALSDEQAGLDEPVVCHAKVKNGEIYTVKLGDAAEGGTERYVRISVGYAPSPKAVEAPEKPSGKVSEKEKADQEAKIKEELKKSEEAKNLNKKLGKWTYLISSDNLDSFFVERDELKKEKKGKQEEKKEEEIREDAIDEEDT